MDAILIDDGARTRGCTQSRSIGHQLQSGMSRQYQPPQIRFTNHGSHYFNKKKIMALINHISLPNGDAGGGDRITCDREEHKLVSIEE